MQTKGIWLYSYTQHTSQWIIRKTAKAATPEIELRKHSGPISNSGPIANSINFLYVCIQNNTSLYADSKSSLHILYKPICDRA